MEREKLIPDGQPDPSVRANSHEMGETIQQALLKVPPAFRETLILCDIQGHAYKEAAEMLNCSINTVASRLARGRAFLARLLEFLKKDVM